MTDFILDVEHQNHHTFEPPLRPLESQRKAIGSACPRLGCNLVAGIAECDSTLHGKVCALVALKKRLTSTREGQLGQGTVKKSATRRSGEAVPRSSPGLIGPVDPPGPSFMPQQRERDGQLCHGSTNLLDPDASA